MRGIGIVAAVAWLAIAACGSQERASMWFVDGQFSEALTGRAQQEELAIGRNAVDTVEVVQIFRSSIDESDLIDVDAIRSHELVYEIRDREAIRGFFHAAQNTVPGDGCDPYQSSTVLHVLAFDPSLGRVGYFRYYSCLDRNLGAMAPIGSRSAYFSKDLAALLAKEE